MAPGRKLGGDPDDDLPDIVDVVAAMGRAPEEPAADAEVLST